MKNVPVSLIALVAVVVLVLLGWAVLQGKVEDEYGLPIIAVFALASMFAVLAFIASVYRSADLGTDKQALGLPEGSVRALIALSLIVIFAVITLFMLARLTSAEKVCAALVATLNATPSVKTDPTVAKDAIAAFSSRQQSAQDLAKQLLTMLGTLLAAVSSFYFGSSSASGANDPSKMAAAVQQIAQATSGGNQGGANPNPGGGNPSGANPGGVNQGGANPGGANPGGANPGGANPVVRTPVV